MHDRLGSQAIERAGKLEPRRLVYLEKKAVAFFAGQFLGREVVLVAWARQLHVDIVALQAVNTPHGAAASGGSASIVQCTNIRQNPVVVL